MTADRDCVCVFAPNWLGDAVMALPAVADLRRHFAAARFVVAARASVAGLFELVPGVDAVVTLKWRARLFSGRSLRDDIVSLRASCDSGTASSRDGVPVRGIAVMLPNSFATAWLAKRTPFVERWGYATDWRRRLLTRALRLPAESTHQGRYYQQLTEALGVASGPLEPRVEVPEAVRQQARAQLRRAGWDERQPLVTMAPGAAYGTAKRWLPKYFAEVIASLRDLDVRTVLVGSAGDAETIRIILGHAAVRAAQPIDMVGATSLHGLAGVLAISAACVSNDSGAMHLAGAIGTPLVALFGPTRETETAPLTRANAYRELLINPVWCRPCMLRECPIDHRCMKGLMPASVLESVGRALNVRSAEERSLNANGTGGLRPTSSSKLDA